MYVFTHDNTHECVSKRGCKITHFCLNIKIFLPFFVLWHSIFYLSNGFLCFLSNFALKFYIQVHVTTLFYRFNNSRQHLFNNRNVPSYRNKSGILFWKSPMVGFSHCRNSIHRRSDVRCKCNSICITWRMRCLMFVEYRRDYRAETAREKRMVSNEP